MHTAEKLAYTVEEACAAIGIGRTKLYALANEHQIDMKRVGGRTLVTAESLQRLISDAEPALPTK